MQRCFLVINKETQVASYLKHRSIIDVTEEHRSLSEIDLMALNIIDADKFLYIYYPTDDSDLSFRSDMNALRNLMSSAFFHVSEALFILVDNMNPLLEDLIYSALRESPLTKNKIEIITHKGSLMLADVGKYLSGSVSGQITSSSYRDVYVTEADKEEKVRFTNSSSGLDSVLPVLTDMAALYQQRSGVEAVSAGRIVSEHLTRPRLVKDFTRINVSTARSTSSFVVSGEKWAQPEKAVEYLLQHSHFVGIRTLVVNLTGKSLPAESVGTATTLDLMDIKAPITPELPTSILDIRLNQLGYVVEYMENIKGVDSYIYYCSDENYSDVCSLIQQLSETMHAVYVTHYNREALELYLSAGYKATALFLRFGPLSKSFDLDAYKADLKDTVVAEFPMEEVDYTEFYEFSTGGGRSE